MTKSLSSTLQKDAVNNSKKSLLTGKTRKGINITFVTGLTLALLIIYLSPFLFMVSTSLKTQAQISILGAPIWPAAPATYEYQGKQVEMFKVPLGKCAGFDPNDTSTQVLAIVKKGLKESLFVNPNSLDKGQ